MKEPAIVGEDAVGLDELLERLDETAIRATDARGFIEEVLERTLW